MVRSRKRHQREDEVVFPFRPDDFVSASSGCHKGKKLSERTTGQHELFQVICRETAA